MKKQNVKLIDVSDWDNLVKTTYKRPYCFQQQDGCKDRGTFRFTVPAICPEDYENETVPEVVNDPKMGVSFDAWLKRDPKTPLAGENIGKDWSLDMWYERNFYPHIEMLINDLYAKGLLEKGNYAIDINW